MDMSTYLRKLILNRIAIQFKESILNTDMHLCLRCIDQVVKIFGDQNEKS